MKTDDEQKPQPTEPTHREPYYVPSPVPAPGQGPGKRIAPEAVMRRLGLLADGSILLALVLVLLAAFGARAQEIPVEASRDGLMLARICAHEAGWNADESGDCAAIHEVLWRNSRFRGMSYRSLGFAYSGRLLRGETRRSYHAELTADGATPPGWPLGAWVADSGGLTFRAGPAWSNFRPRWLELVAHAEWLVAQDPDDVSPCEVPVDDWGGAIDAARAERLALIPVECGDTHNTFYARPSRIGRSTPE